MKNVLMNERIRTVILVMQKSKVDRNLISPNYVADVADDMGIKLTSEEIVYISDNY